MFTGCGQYLKGEAVGRGQHSQGQLVLQTALWPCSSPQPVLQPLALEQDSEQEDQPSAVAGLQKHHGMSLCEAMLTLPNPWPESDLTECLHGLETVRKEACEAVNDCHY